MDIRRVETPAEKSETCEHILRTLPEWFGIEESLVNYVREAASLSMWAAYAPTGEAIGFVCLKEHTAYAAEVAVMGVLPTWHRTGAGRALIAACERHARGKGMPFLTVKTLDESAQSEEYDRTRRFYRAMGFLPLEVFPLLWDPSNPCLLMAKWLGSGTEL